MINIGLIPAAGEGSRLRPLTTNKPKAMIEVGSKPLIQRNIEIMRDSLGIKSIYIIVGRFSEVIKDFFNDGSDFGVRISYIDQPTRLGIARAIYMAKDLIKEAFVVILGDEIYLNSNHESLSLCLDDPFDAICTFKAGAAKERITNNFTGDIKDGRVISLIEKPQNPQSDLLGCGTYVLDPVVFDFIEKTPASALRGEVEITDVLNNMATSGRNVKAFMLEGGYVNVNRVSDIDFAEKILGSTAGQKC